LLQILETTDLDVVWEIIFGSYFHFLTQEETKYYQVVFLMRCSNPLTSAKISEEPDSFTESVVFLHNETLPWME